VGEEVLVSSRTRPGRLKGTASLQFAFATTGLIALIAPALWNGYPLLQYDTGGYLARWYEGYLVPSRSTVFGLYLHLGQGWHFWPQLIAQSLLTLWVLALVLRTHGVTQSWRAYCVTLAALCLATTLPFLTSVLLTDIFAGLSALALTMLLFRGRKLSRSEALGLMAVVAFAAATHSATMATLIAILILGVIAAFFLGADATSGRALLNGACAIAVGAGLLLAANFALSGRLQWTPGGYGIAFGRMLQDGIVTRYLDAHCPHENLKLCPYRHEFPATADEFLWNDGPFNKLGRFDGLGDEMRHIVLGSLVEYPGRQLLTAVAATLEQLGMVATGAGVHDKIWHTYGIIEKYIPGEAAAMHAARQQHGALDFTLINRLDVPVAILSMALLLVPLSRFRRWKEDGGLALLAASVTVALFANAFVCGALSGPHARYGARMSWVLTLVVIIMALRALGRARVSPAAGHTAVPSVP
jgi:hypothetical protein